MEGQNISFFEEKHEEANINLMFTLFVEENGTIPKIAQRNKRKQ